MQKKITPNLKIILLGGNKIRRRINAEEIIAHFVFINFNL